MNQTTATQCCCVAYDLVIELSNGKPEHAQQLVDVGVIPKIHESIQQYSKLLPEEIAIIGNLIWQNSVIL